MSIHAADALMEIFGFKRVANDEKPLDNPPSLDDDCDSLNEGTKMEEAKNEGLEVVAMLTVSFDEGDGGSAIEQVETHMLLDEGAHDLCRHSEALAGYAVRDARIAELELPYTKMCERMWELESEHDQLRAELAALNAKLDASKFCANVADDLRAELSALKAQEPIGWYTEDHLDDKSATTYSWTVAERWVEKGWPVSPLYAAPAAPAADAGVNDHD